MSGVAKKLFHLSETQISRYRFIKKYGCHNPAQLISQLISLAIYLNILNPILDREGMGDSVHTERQYKVGVMFHWEDTYKAFSSRQTSPLEFKLLLEPLTQL